LSYNGKMKMEKQIKGKKERERNSIAMIRLVILVRPAARALVLLQFKHVPK